MLCLSAPRADRNGYHTGEWLYVVLCLSAPLADRNLEQQAYNRWYNDFVSAHRLQIATANVHKAPRADLWNAL